MKSLCGNDSRLTKWFCYFIHHFFQKSCSHIQTSFFLVLSSRLPEDLHYKKQGLKRDKGERSSMDTILMIWYNHRTFHLCCVWTEYYEPFCWEHVTSIQRDAVTRNIILQRSVTNKDGYFFLSVLHSSCFECNSFFFNQFFTQKKKISKCQSH